MKRVGIVCALAAEARHLGPTTPPHQALASLADGTLLAVSGMGGNAAGVSARALIEAGAGALASFGLAGGLDPALPAGASFLPSEVSALNAAPISTTAHWRERLSAALAAHSPLTQGRLLSCPRAVATVAQKAALFRETGAVAVDMESVAVAEAAGARHLPFIAVRVIVDTAQDSLPPSVSAAADSTGPLQLWRLIGALACSPAQLAPLIRLARRYRLASRSLAVVGRAGSLAAHAFS